MAATKVQPSLLRFERQQSSRSSQNFISPKMKSADPVSAIDKLWEDYDCQWPPRPKFDGWPSSWTPYVETCDAMPDMLHSGSTPQEFREWMRDQLHKKVNLREVMDDVRKHYSKADRSLLGFFGCLTYLKNGYRWGALPAVQEERQRQTLVFPQIIDQPMVEISQLYGVAPYGHIFSLKITNTIYENDKPVRMRFHFNNDKKIQKSEENFFLSFVDVDNVFQEAVAYIREYLHITKEAEADIKMAVRHFSRRAELLDKIRSVMVKASKVFSFYTQGDKIDKDDWGRYVQSAATWGLEGKGGASGGETFIFQLLDEFLHIPGKCLMYRSKPLRREHMPDGLCDILYALSKSDHKTRFQSLLGLDGSADPIAKGKDELIRNIHLWRLSHAHVVRRFLTASEGLATTLDKKVDMKTSLALTFEKELLERARETNAAKEVKHSPMANSVPVTTGVSSIASFAQKAISSFMMGMADYYMSWFD